MKRRQFEPKVLVGLRGIQALRGVRGSASSGWTNRSRNDALAVAAHPTSRATFPRWRRPPGWSPRRSSGTWGRFGGNVCVDTRCNYYNQSYEWRKAIGFCMKKDGDICLVAPGARVLGRVLVGHAPVLWALGARLRLVGAGGERTIRWPRSIGTTVSSTSPSSRTRSLRYPVAPGKGLALGVPQAPAPRLIRLSRARRGGGPPDGG